MKRLLLWVVGVGSFVGLLWVGWSFRAGNGTPIDLDLIWIQLSGVELWRVLAVSIAIGAILAGTLVGFAWLRIRLLNRRYRRAIRRLEAELHELRSLPLSGSDTEYEDAATSAVSSAGQR